MKTNYIKEWLVSNNMTQVDLASRIKVDKINFNKVVNNKRALDIETAEKIGNVFGCHWSLLFERRKQQSDIHGFIKKDCSVEFITPIKHTPQTVFFHRPVLNLEDCIVIEEIAYFGVHIFEKKPHDYPCWALNLIEDTQKNKWFLAFRNNIKTETNECFENEYNVEEYYFNKEGLSIYEIYDDDKSKITNVKMKKSFKYHHIVATEYDVTYQQYNWHYQRKDLKKIKS